MKIVINLNDKDYELLKNAGITIDFNTLFHGKERDRELTFSTFNLIESLKNGTPYNPTDDLISREVINSEIEKRYCSKHCVVSSEEPYCSDNCPARLLKNIVKECSTVAESRR